jgi:hypothetical protein
MSKIFPKRRSRKESPENKGRQNAKSTLDARRSQAGTYVKRDVDSDTGLYIVPIEELDKVPG